MMIRAAGGPGLVSPLDYGERKTPLPKSTWIAIGVVALAHVGVGLALYYQRFELAVIPTTEPEPIRGVYLELPKPPPPEPVVTEQRPAPPPPIHRSTAITQQTETLPFDFPDEPSASTTGPLVDFTPAPDPAPTGTTIQPTPPQPSLITNPSWSRRPNADQMTRAYPSRALDEGVSGSVSLNCLVQSDGYVADCRVTRETPDSHGFGRAAQGLTRYFRVNPRTVDGVAQGSRVNIALRFQPPAD